MQYENKLTRMVKSRAIDCSKPVITDQSYKKACDINNIIKAYAKTGILPEGRQGGTYGDFSNIPTLEIAFEAVNNAKEAFLSLPADVRKLIDNDPSKLANFVADEQNYEICLKYGLIEARKPSTQDVANGDNTSSQGDNSANVTN